MSLSNSRFEENSESPSHLDDYCVKSRDATSARNSSPPVLDRKRKRSEEDGIESENESEQFSSGSENENSSERSNKEEEVSIPITHEIAPAPVHAAENTSSSSDSEHGAQQAQPTNTNNDLPASAQNPRQKRLAISASTPPKKSHKRNLHPDEEAYNMYTAPPATHSPSDPDRKPQHPKSISTFRRGKSTYQLWAENPFGPFQELQTCKQFEPRRLRSNEKAKAWLRKQSELMKIAFEIFIGEREDGERRDKYAVRYIPGFVYATRHPLGAKRIEDYRRENIVRGVRAYPLDASTDNETSQQPLANYTEQQTLPEWTRKVGSLPRGSFVFFYLQRTRQPASVAPIKVLREQALKYIGDEPDKVWLDMLTFVTMVSSCKGAEEWTHLEEIYAKMDE